MNFPILWEKQGKEFAQIVKHLKPVRKKLKKIMK